MTNVSFPSPLQTRTLARALSLLALTLPLLVNHALAQNTVSEDELLIRYERTLEEFDLVLPSLGEDPTEAVTRLDRGIRALRTLTPDVSRPLLDSIDATRERAEAAITRGSQSDVEVQLATLEGATRRLLYEAALRAQGEGDAATARARIDALARDLALPSARRTALRSASDVPQMRRALEAASAERIIGNLDALLIAGGTGTVAEQYLALSRSYADYLLVQDAPDLPAGTTERFASAITALLAGEVDTYLAHVGDVVMDLTTLRDAADEASAPVDATPTTVQAAPETDDGVNPTTPPAPAASDALTRELAGYPLTNGERERLATLLEGRGVTSIDEATRSLLADAALLAHVTLHGEASEALEAARTLARTFETTLAPLVVAIDPSSDRAIRGYLTRLTAATPQRGDALGLQREFAALPTTLDGTPRPAHLAWRAEVNALRSGPVDAVALTLLLLLMVTLLVTTARMASAGRTRVTIGLALVLLPLMTEFAMSAGPALLASVGLTLGGALPAWAPSEHPASEAIAWIAITAGLLVLLSGLRAMHTPALRPGGGLVSGARRRS